MLRTMKLKSCPKTGYFSLISRSRLPEQHVVDKVRVDLFVSYRRCICDLPPQSMVELARETLN